MVKLSPISMFRPGKPSTGSIIPALLFIISIIFGIAYANNVSSGGQQGIVRTLSAQTHGKFGILAGGALKYDRHYDFLKGPDGKDYVVRSDGSVVQSRSAPQIASGIGFIAYGLTQSLDMGITLPVYWDNTGFGLTQSGVGDLEIALKFAHPFRAPNAYFQTAYFTKVSIPTGRVNQGYFPRHSYYIDKGTDPGNELFTASVFTTTFLVLWTVDFSKPQFHFPLSVHINAGGLITQKNKSNALLGTIGAEYQPLDLITIFLECAIESRLVNHISSYAMRHLENDPVYLTPGIKFHLPHSISVIAAGDFGVSSQDNSHRIVWNRDGYKYSTAPNSQYGLHLSATWSLPGKAADYDNDGIPDHVDKCPNAPEDKDGFEDDDGCPDLDNDNDGILDEKDECPNEPMAFNGCPIYDTDNDGIPDSSDKCVDEPEDKDGFEDDDGCPDLDNDNDGINDTKDACPDLAEDFDGYEDRDGCPDPDNDNDGVLDDADECPTVKGAVENKGCPETKEIGQRLLLEGVNFQSGSATLTPNSFRILDGVYESLKEWTNVKVEIRGHTDSQGNDSYNLQLSQRRAESVMEYLIAKGIESSRLRSSGRGETEPITSNNTADGRARNRRVELHRID
jgi:outer membrane protein OmpA-like peptidoglycan-associated protein